jgi:mycofactocin precursor
VCSTEQRANIWHMTAAAPEADLADVLVEEISIDGMCGVY